MCLVFDLFDGTLARKFEAFSDFGAELDSLVDFLCFGIAPAILAYNMLLIHKPLYGGILCIFFVICAASRLARFNSCLSSDLSVKHDFKGLPVPAAAAFIVSYIIFANELPHKMHLTILIAIILLSSLLMVSSVQFRPLKPSARKNIFVKLFVCAILVASIWQAAYIYFPLCLLLLLQNLLLNLGQKYHKS